MSEQISHKRESNSKKQKQEEVVDEEQAEISNEVQQKEHIDSHSKERRRKLKEFYNLDKPAEETPSIETPKESTKDVEEEKPLNERTFKSIMHQRNAMLKKEQEKANAIKNTIYENYLDLVRVHDLLDPQAESSRMPAILQHSQELEQLLDDELLGL